MRHFRIRSRQLWLLLGLLVWLFGSSAQRVHVLLVQHVRCPIHGELLELDSQGEASAAAAEGRVTGAHADAPQLSQERYRGEHGDLCHMDATLAPTIPPLLLPPVPQYPSGFRPPLRPTTGTPRGPPLAYAPKTSPPAIA